MANETRPPERGRPPRVTPERIAAAVLEIRGREPSLAELADHLAVARATLYSHLRGRHALRRFAQNAVLENWVLSKPRDDEHWAVWAREFAWEIRGKLADYPYLSDAMSGTRADLPGQVSHTERVMAQLVALGLPPEEAFLLLRCLIVLVVGLEAQPWGQGSGAPESAASFIDWVRVHPIPVPTLSRLLDMPLFDGVEGGRQVFDMLLGFLLRGMAERRGEALSEAVLARLRRPLPRAS